MILRQPFEISSRLMPSVRIGGATLSVGLGRGLPSGRTLYDVWIDLPDGSEHEITDLKSGRQGGSVQKGMCALLSFLSAAAESRAYSRHSGEKGENEDLFCSEIVAWADDNSDELSMLACILEESGDLINGVNQHENH